MRAPTSARIVERMRQTTDERAALVAGLRASPPCIAPKYFYDALGCALYAAICETPEYYPTRTEAGIFAAHAEAIASRVPAHATLVDLGAGDGRKAQWWLPRLAASGYLAVDFATGALQATVDRMREAFPALEARGVAADFTRGLDLAPELPRGHAEFFYPGSSIGNFAPDDALALLRDVHAHARGGRSVGLLIGVDTHKDAVRLESAYDDRLGVTAAFNRNVLNHVNAVLGTGFNVDAFRHVAQYDERHRRIEMHLEAVIDHVVMIDGVERRFVPGERILTEHSYKYTPSSFEGMLRDAGFASIGCWTDVAGDFAVFHAA